MNFLTCHKHSRWHTSALTKFIWIRSINDPDEKSRAPQRDPYGNTPRLKDTLDLGFPYDDGDNTIND